MQNLLFQTICRVGIFMICAQAMIHFRPQEAYEKYLKLLVSIMVLIQLFLPVGSFLLGGGGQQAADLLEQFKKELEQSMADAERKAAEAEAVLEQMTLEELRRRLEEESVQAGEKKEGAGEAEGQMGDKREGEMGNAQDGDGETMGAEVWSGEKREGGTEGRDGIEIGAVEVEPVAPITIEGAPP